MEWSVLLIAFLLLHHIHDAASNLSRKRRVVGGYLSLKGLFPYAVSLRLDRTNPAMHFCGGAIITSRFIISSAHCMRHADHSEVICYKGKYVGYNDMKTRIIAVVGTLKLDSSSGQEHLIESYMYHRDFSFKSGINDISLLKTATDIEFNRFTQPIPIRDHEVPIGASVIVAGWGLTSYPGEASNILKFLDLRTISYEECADIWTKVHASQICTYTRTGEGVCTSDSGGPLIYNEELAGLVSFGKPCAVGYPDIFTNVSHMKYWIHYNVNCLSAFD